MPTTNPPQNLQATAGLTPEAYTRRFYDLHAEEYFAATYSRDLSPLWDAFCERLRRRACILDIGSGSGRDVEYFHRHGHTVVGLDSSLPLLRLARAYTGGAFVHGDYISLPFHQQSFDGIWALASLLHVCRTNIQAVLREIRVLLKQRGVLLTSVKYGHGEGLDVLGRYNVYYTGPQWASLLERAGFAVIQGSQMTERRPSIGLPTNTHEVTWLTYLATTT
jgi:SAM-dependent methyltransferase